ncbi:protein-L-isoaspartate(D-aspartate) O-methyltransferase [Breoghania sp.]|uniref:protein-L-isoaspartate(D-aspartate) O-methyltransferase n=1 Tax=Breoghania sp. TaxID=2065378 RepID=UPI00262884B5|nr:protein-L-isoaspartate(D-aspartate) O-methyltransferase [Breoghania sp.]MDJ0929621.1 protein-L-isoaspartate(D-aspartate) O-methyltransferase [Breoghania sp.]
MSDADDDAPLRSEMEREACLGLILDLRSRGIRDTRLLSAIERVPRRLFLSARQHTLAYVDTQLPIECGQTTPAPSVMARMIEALELKPEHRVLHVGSGSGYQAVVLGQMVNEVVTLERYRTLVDLAHQRFVTLKLTNVEIRHADGLAGLKGKDDDEVERFDRILLSGSVATLPRALMDNLDEGGTLVAPIGPAGAEQRLMRLTADGKQDDLGPVRLVPLAEGLATRL